MGAIFFWVEVLWASVVLATLSFSFSGSLQRKGSSSYSKVDLYRLVCMGLCFSRSPASAAFAWLAVREVACSFVYFFPVVFNSAALLRHLQGLRGGILSLLGGFVHLVQAGLQRHHLLMSLGGVGLWL